MEPVAPSRRELFQFGIDLIKKLRGRVDLFEAGVMLDAMTDKDDDLYRRSLHYDIRVTTGGPDSILVGLTVFRVGWHPAHARTISEIVFQEWVTPDQLATRMGELAGTVIRESSALRQPWT